MLTWAFFSYFFQTFIWNLLIGQTLLVKQEPTNSHNRHSVDIYKDDVIVGHVPYNLASILSAFSQRENKSFSRSNRSED